ncbi:hypothetical protein J4E85_010314 [Alternaria conjuncta]|uniref:uncharacterized protein n=1 Tax=Alternaria conjuncta TaxID=181017 RepID=UPI00221F976D|nr:uncharacterized protein J4E85_010314 [Alternaria conjuncta]KAI4916226.1 hypothetical protein J4E85_010314 [Alternaria conjuncta]
MRFSIASTTAVMVALAASGTAFVIDTFGDRHCGGNVQQTVNIWDDTCAAWPQGFGSFRITTWGGNHQFAYFFAPDSCGNPSGAIGSGYVDSTTFDYAQGRCYNFNGASANAIASYYKA